MKFSGERFIPDICDAEITIEHYQRYKFATMLTEKKVVLDAACGEGYGTEILSKKSQKVYGLDISEESIEHAKEKYNDEKLSFVCGSIDKLPFDDDFFDVIVSFETIEHIDENLQKKFLAETKRVLKDNGILIISTPNKAIYTDLVGGNNEFHIKEFYVKEYQEFLKSYYTKLKLYCQFPDVGYYITEPDGDININYYQKGIEFTRYILAVCSDYDIKINLKLDNLTEYSDDMYYFLNKTVHKQESTLIKVNSEAIEFEKRQNSEIENQKEYISHLENDINEQKEYIRHLENDINEQKEYIRHLERDILTLKKYIEYNKL